MWRIQTSVAVPAQPSSIDPWEPKPLPALLNGFSIIDDSQAASSARFATSSKYQAIAQTATSLTVEPGRAFAPFKATDLTFRIETPQSFGRNSTPSTPTAEINMQFGQESQIQPPAKRLRLDAGDAGMSARKTYFCTKRPVKKFKDVDLDVWRQVLSSTDLKFLLQAKTVCRWFYTILQDQSIWRTCRERTYGRHAPPNPPGDLSEQFYADLLVGRGCQIKYCPKTKTSKVYWAFQARLCTDCFRKRTLSDIPDVEEIPGTDHLTILDLIPAALMKSGKYNGCRQMDRTRETFQWTVPDGRKAVFLKRDFDAIRREYQERMETDPSEQSLKDWAINKFLEVGQLMDDSRDSELWEKTIVESNPNNRIRRAAFFQTRAERLTPPMSLEVLMMMKAYHTAVAITSPPTEAVWESLKAKILPYRERAESLARLAPMVLHRPPTFNSHAGMDIFRRLHFHRKQRQQPEQVFVRALGKIALQKCKELGSADSDLVLHCLQIVYDDFEKIPTAARPQGMNTEGITGAYQLSLDDARMLVEDVISPDVGNHSRRGKLTFANLKCIGCPRKDCSTRYTFTLGLEHILQQHAWLVGEGSDFNQFLRPFPFHVDYMWFRFPWYTVRWTRCLPLVPGYYPVDRTTIWDPDVNLEFNAPRTGEVSAYTGLMAYENPQVQNDDFIGNFVYAGTAVKDTLLSGESQFAIALRYAVERYTTASERPPALEDLKRSIIQLRATDSTVDFRFRCGICVKDDTVYGNSKFVKNPVAFDKLEKHWDSEHADEHEWTADMMQLPTEEEIHGQLLVADESLKQQQKELSERAEQRDANPKIKRNAKAPVVWSLVFARDVFAKLFVTRPHHLETSPRSEADPNAGQPS